MANQQNAQQDKLALVEQTEEIPQTLTQAHEQLENILSKEDLGVIDQMASEDKMIHYHFGLGTWMRNEWGLWKGSALAKHMNDLGFAHPDDMSSVILETFWFRRHGKDFTLYLKEQVIYYRTYWENAKKPKNP